jgi:uncharacterized membrane protein YhaH (DUF805 family)
MTSRALSWLDPHRPMGRSAYWIAGVLLFGVKHGMDRFVAFGFGRKWSLFNYIDPGDLQRLGQLTPLDRKLYGALLLVAIPFIAIGVLLTLRRLNDAGLRGWLVALFFVPFVNLLFFLLLSMLPTDRVVVPRGGSRPPLLSRILPESFAGSAIAGVAVSAVLGTAIVAFALRLIPSYGGGLFLGVPFCAGLVSAALFGHGGDRTLGASLGLACLSVAILGLLVIAVAIEGLVCVVMAAPLALPLACLGGWIGHAIQKRSSPRLAGVAGALVLPLALPGLIAMETARVSRPDPEMLVQSEVIIAGSPERVWSAVVQFKPLPPPKELLFRAGIAYPTRAEIRGKGAGALRRCVFSTGSFVEPITVWDEPRRLAFSVAEQPRILTELTPYREIHAPHLDGYFTSTHGEFVLTPLPGGRTRLAGLTWYRHAIWPTPYWRLWSDAIIHTIHQRVLDGIRKDVERG